MHTYNNMYDGLDGVVCIFFLFVQSQIMPSAYLCYLKYVLFLQKNIYLHCFQVVWIAIMGNADWKPLQFLCFAFFYRILQKLRATEPPITPIYNVRHFLMLVCHLMSYSVYIFMVMSSMMLLLVTIWLSKFPLLITVVVLRQK